VRPWKPPQKPITYWRPVAARASLSAPSTASVPELVRNARTGPRIGAVAASASQNSE
jgi:hypothetical protein